jgi:chromosome condensin MukBEF ATPase and DNA-binding subunit MukB
MIDQTNTRIEEMEAEVKRENERRYAFQRLLRLTDEHLWRLEEMNRDGVKTVPPPMREEIRDTIEQLPDHCKEPFRDSEQVQEMLDSVFEVQERLFRWRHPEFPLDDELEDELDRAS